MMLFSYFGHAGVRTSKRTLGHDRRPSRGRAPFRHSFGLGLHRLGAPRCGETHLSRGGPGSRNLRSRISLNRLRKSHPRSKGATLRGFSSQFALGEVRSGSHFQEPRISVRKFCGSGFSAGEIPSDRTLAAICATCWHIERFRGLTEIISVTSAVTCRHKCCHIPPGAPSRLLRAFRRRYQSVPPTKAIPPGLSL